MNGFFGGLYNVWEIIREMAWQATIVILIVLFCRLIVGKISKQASYFLWVIVAFRLICPVMLPSDFSIFNLVGESIEYKQMTAIADRITNSELENINTNVSEKIDNNQSVIFTQDANDIAFTDKNDNVDDTILSEKQMNVNENQVSNLSMIKNVFVRSWDMVIWFLVMTIILFYGMISYLSLKHRLRFAIKSGDGIFESDRISSPFVFGIFKPAIYLPYHLTEQEKRYILRHEQYHIKRKDYLVKIFAFVLLAVYWFHPLVWAAFYLMSRDMEVSCDEYALRNLSTDDRKAYSTLLLNFAREKRMPLPSPLSFGENDTKSRIKQILNYKKPTFWGILAVVILVVVVVVCCLTDAKDGKNTKDGVESTENVDGALTEKGLPELAKQLYEAKNPYLGEMSANGKILNLLWSAYGITGSNGTEMQTTDAPYWITISFDTKPDDIAMWKASAVFLAMVENCNEVRWKYYDENKILCTYYVSTDDVNTFLNCNDIKEYAADEAAYKNALADYPLYQEIIDKYVLGHNEGWDINRHSEENISSMFSYPETYENGGYYLFDVDGNGMDELIIGENGESDTWNGVIYEMYTIENDQLVRVLSGWERNRYYLCENSVIAKEGSGGAANSTYEYYNFSGSEMTLREAVIYDAWVDVDHPWFYSTVGDEAAQGEAITEEKAYEIMAGYQHVVIDYISFEE